MGKTFSYKLYNYEPSINEYGVMQTKTPDLRTLCTTDFTNPSTEPFHIDIGDNKICLASGNKLLSLILDISGSMLWNDFNNDKIAFYKRLLESLQAAYPGDVRINLLSFGGTPVKSEILLTTEDTQTISFGDLKTQLMSDSIYDLAGIRVVRKTSGYPQHPGDGTIVADGLFEDIKDENLQENTLYYYTIFTYNKEGHYSSGVPLKFSTHNKVIPKGIDSFSTLTRILPGVERDSNTLLIYNYSEKTGTVLYDSSGNNNHGNVVNTTDEQFWKGAPLSSDTDQYKEYVGGRNNTTSRIETLESSNSFTLDTAHNFTFNFWIYRFATSVEETLASISDGVTYQYDIRMAANGTVNITAPGTAATSTEIIPEKEWTMVTITLSNDGSNNLQAQFYFNGFIDDAVIPVTNYPVAIANPHVFIGGGINTNSLYGAISNFSLHDTARSDNYIHSLYSQESKIFYNDPLLNQKEIPDNSQREVLLQWTIADDYDYSDVKIVRKYNEIPYHLDDGIIIYEESLTPGSYAFIDSNNLINDGKFYYRFFTINSTGNSCTLPDARISPAYIPSINTTVDSGLIIYNAVIIPGNHKTKISWNPISSNIKGIKIYYSLDDYPTLNAEKTSSDNWDSLSLPLFTGTLLCDTTNSLFVHRMVAVKSETAVIDVPLTNNIPYFYTLVAYDEKGNTSSPIHLKSVPSSTYSDVEFPSDNVTGLWAELVNRQGISLHWTSPGLEINSLDLWFGETAVFYARIADLYGETLPNLANFEIKIDSSAERRDSSITPPEIEYNVKYGIENGIFKGTITPLTDPTLLSATEQYEFVVSLYYKIVDPTTKAVTFEYKLPSISVKFKNPTKMEAQNLLNSKVPAIGESLGASVDKSSENYGRPCSNRFCNEGVNPKFELVNGGYTYSKNPYICRVFVSYQDSAVEDGTPVVVNLYKSGTLLTPEHASVRQGTYTTTSQTFESLDSQGRPIGASTLRSFIDVPMSSPNYPELVDLYATFTANKITVSVIHTLLWASTLKFELQTRTPSADGIDVAEQICNIYFVDPDYPDDVSKRIPIRDDVTVKWTLTKGAYYKERPFYSLDRISQRTSGVYSRTKNGIARNVWFGPVSNIESHIHSFTCEGVPDTCCIGEEYKISAQIIEDEENVVVSKWIGYSCDATEQKATYSKILFDGVSNQKSSPPHYFAYADGEELVHLQIASDPTNSLLSSAQCFVDCMNYHGNPIIPLPCGQLVNIYTGGLDQGFIKEKRYSEAGVEVIWNAVFDEDPYTGERTLKTYDILSPTLSALSQTEHVAHVPVDGSTTDLYLRLNRFIGRNGNPEKCKESDSLSLSSVMQESNGIRPCEKATPCYPVETCTGKIWTWNNVQPISCATTLVANNKTVTLTGGGTYADGVPPVLVGFREPLNVAYLAIRINGINGQQATDIVVDGITRYTFVVEITFSGKPVPDGTPVYIEIEDVMTQGSSSIITTSSPLIYTHLTHDPELDDARSLAYFELNPLPETNFNVNIKAKCKYDKRGDAIREMVSSVTIGHIVDEPVDIDVTPEEEPEAKKTKVFSNEIILYNIDSDSYTELTALQYSRSGHFSAIADTSAMYHAGDHTLYLIGGFDGNLLLSNVEKYEVGSTESEIVNTAMPTPRAFGQTVYTNDKIYCIGGLEYDLILKTFVVSRKIEYFDIVSETWMPSLASMPENYGIAFGSAEVVGNNIFVLCGVNTVTGDCEPGQINTKILKYNISSDEWEILEPSNVELYSRISPFAFLVNSSIYIYGGSVPKDNGYLSQEMKTYLDYRMSEFETSLYSSTYYSSLTDEEKTKILSDEKIRLISDELSISPFHYLDVGYIYNTVTNAMSELDEQWVSKPVSRYRGCAVYDPSHELAYFIGGSNNTSPTLSLVESINVNTSVFSNITSLSRGKALFSANIADRMIYIVGGSTSGHTENWTHIEASVLPNIVEAKGEQRATVLITLRDDAGNILDEDVRVLVRGYLKIPGVSERLALDTATNAVARINAQATNNATLMEQYLNNIVNPNSDEFQFDSQRRINEEVSLFPVLFSSNEFIVHGVGTTTLQPRSEDPFTDLENLSKTMSDASQETRDSTRATASGATVTEQLTALESIINSIQTEKVTIENKQKRDLYEIEIQVTILDSTRFGQTVCQTDLQTLQNIYAEVNKQISTITADDVESQKVPDVGNTSVTFGEVDSSTIFSTTDSNRSGQSVKSRCLFGINSQPRKQYTCPTVQYYNVVDWIPTVTEHLNTNDSSLEDGIEQLDLLEDVIPFGSSQLYNALYDTAQILTDDSVTDWEKVIYVNSDAYENLSSVTLNNAIEEINSIDGEKKTPVIYTIFDTSFPTTISSQLAKSQAGTVEELAVKTGGHSTVLTSSSFLNQVLNFVISVSGGLGYGLYRKKIDLGGIATVSKLTTVFELYVNTSGTIRYRYGNTGRVWSDWSEEYDANSTVHISNMQAKYIEFEIKLQSGFITDTEDPYFTETGIPCALSICWEYSLPREDYLLLNCENTTGNAQQMEASVNGTVPTGGLIEIGAASSDASSFEEFYSDQRPLLEESNKTWLLDRSEPDDASIIEREVLTTLDGLVFTSPYGKWSETAVVKVYDKDSDGNYYEMATTAYKGYPQNGQIILQSRKPLGTTLEMTLVNENKIKVGLKISNSNHSEPVSIEGVGYMYAVNTVRPPPLSQVPPRVTKVVISPQAPKVTSAISVSYVYTDLNRNAESGTLIRWFKNGTPLLEINDKSSWTDADLLLSNKLKPDDSIFATVQPSDGLAYGSLITSSAIKIVQSPPEAQEVTLISTRDGLLNSRFDTGSVITSRYNFVTTDSGISALEVNSEISWYVNGTLYKKVTYSTGDNEFIAKSLFPYEKIISTDSTGKTTASVNDVSVFVIGNTLYSECTPKTATVTGETIRSQTVTIENSLPIAKNVSILPLNPSVNSTLTASFTIDDPDFTLSGQTNQTEVKWFKSVNGGVYSEVTELKNMLLVSPSKLTAGDSWKYTVYPSDSSGEVGLPVSSNSVLILPV